MNHPQKFRECMKILKTMIMQHYAGETKAITAAIAGVDDSRPVSNTSAISNATSGFDETVQPNKRLDCDFFLSKYCRVPGRRGLQ